MGAPENINLSDFTSLETTIGNWIKNGKMVETGFAYSAAEALASSRLNDGLENLRYDC